MTIKFIYGGMFPVPKLQENYVSIPTSYLVDDKIPYNGLVKGFFKQVKSDELNIPIDDVCMKLRHIYETLLPPAHILASNRIDGIEQYIIIILCHSKNIKC